MTEFMIDYEFAELPYRPESARERGWSEEEIERTFGKAKRERAKDSPDSGQRISLKSVTSHLLSSLKSLLTAIKQTAGAERYRKDIWGAVQNLWNGSISRADFIGVMNQLIPIAFEQAWLEAVRGEGITSIDELEDEERAELQKRIDLELTFVEGFADWIIAHSKAEGFKLRSLAPRVNMWVARYMDIHDQAKQLAGGVKKYEFVYDPEKENCRSCLKLNGQVRRMSAWKKFDCRPKHPDLECMHSANGPTVCGCEFVETDKPASRGPLPKWRAV
jgi:hypothetical protein